MHRAALCERYIERIQDQAATILGASRSAGEVLVQLDCSPARCAPHIGSTETFDQALIRCFHDAVVATPKVPVKGDVSFMVHFQIAP